MINLNIFLVIFFLHSLFGVLIATGVTNGTDNNINEHENLNSWAQQVNLLWFCCVYVHKIANIILFFKNILEEITRKLRTFLIAMKLIA